MFALSAARLVRPPLSAAARRRVLAAMTCLHRRTLSFELPGGQLDLSALSLGGKKPESREKQHEHGFDADLIVIGGGSGGIACARRAAELGADVALFDYVAPSPQGSTWGLGGTCVNVGCIPKKLFHYAGLLGSAHHDARALGWALPERPAHDWAVLTQTVQDHIKSLNWGYRTALWGEGVDIVEARATFVDAHTVRYTDAAGDEQTKSAQHLLVAVGGRPTYPDFPGALEHCISSDDLFSLPAAPGRTLLVGAGYIALECAGFLNEFGCDTTVMMRSIPLRGFDRQMSELVVGHMEATGTRFVRGATPRLVERVPETGQLRVVWGPSSGGDAGEVEEVFDTVVLATGRTPTTEPLDLEAAGVAVTPSGHVAPAECGAHPEETSAASVFAVGDVLAGAPELTPVAIRAGQLLAERLFDSSETPMDYSSVATAVFTPLEYGCVGMSEDDAIDKYGEDAVEVFHARYLPVELAAVHRPDMDDPPCYAKVVCERGGSGARVLGMHVIGPAAGDVIQGFAVAVRLGMTKGDLDATVGIHPTHAEELVLLDKTKRTDPDYVKTSC